MFERIRFLYSYNDEKVARFINCMKYRPSLVLAKKAGRQLGYNLSSLFEYYDWDLLLPIPSAPQSIYERRFNQCAVFIREICHSHTHLSGCFSALKHRGYKNVQASLNAKSRIHNVKNSFYAEQTLVANKKILLIDDVVTTGATSQSAARAIADAGAASIDLLSFARSDNWQEHRYAIFKNI